MTESSNIYKLTIQQHNICIKHRYHPHILDALSPQTKRQLSLRLSTTETFDTQQRLNRRDTTIVISTAIDLLCKIRSIKPELKLIHLPLSFVLSFVNQHTNNILTVRRIDAFTYRLRDTYIYIKWLIFLSLFFEILIINSWNIIIITWNIIIIVIVIWNIIIIIIINWNSIICIAPTLPSSIKCNTRSTFSSRLKLVFFLRHWLP